MVFIIIFAIILFLCYLSTFRMNKKKFEIVNIICGLPGAGKTTYAAYLTKHFTQKKKYKKIGYRVYSNVPIIGAYPYDFQKEFGAFSMENACIICDEAGLVANNRDFKNFKYMALEYLKLLRHRGNLFFCFSQTWDDMDLKIRSMAGMIWICSRSSLPFVTKLIPVRRRIGVDEETKEMKDIFYIDHPVKRFFTTRRFFRPFYYKFFDSYEAPYLPPYPKNRAPYSRKEVVAYKKKIEEQVKNSETPVCDALKQRLQNK